jgi:Cdc6-like AAA superfamily ATPase
LNRVIEKEGVELVIVMKNPEKMEQGRPVLMYNIFEWMNSVQVNQHLRFILITREITFLDTREKRVRSRMNMPLVFCAPPRTDKIK